MDQEEKKYWLAFSAFFKFGPTRFRLLKDYFGSAKKAFNASASALKQTGLSEKSISDFMFFRKNFEVSSYLLRLEQLGVRALCNEEDDYPERLKEVDDKPIVLYTKNRKKADYSILNQKAIGIVGTREITAYGRQVTKAITGQLVRKNFVIVSGLALGVDKVAHQTAIDNKGLTIGVLGCGLDRVYPLQHQKLALEIIESGGMLVSEFPLETKIAPGNFPLRNRIISGLSLGVVVTQAAEKSGSLITARLAAEQGREVFAVPGPINSKLSLGTSSLLKKGAKLVTEVDDILEEFNF